MKNKKNYLKLAFLFEIAYIIYSLIYYIFIKKFDSSSIANLFIISISIFLCFILYKESKKDIDYLKNNNIKILLISIWMFFETIIPGILGFLFLSSIKDKKESKLPIIKTLNINRKEKIKQIFTITLFITILFVLPNISLFKNIPRYFIYGFILLYIIILYYKELISNFKIFIKNIKVYLPFIIKRYFIMLLVMLIVAIPIVLINNGKVSGNQESINLMFKKIPVITLLLSCIYAPITEEVVFRLSLSKLFNNKTLFIIVSGFIFGLLHVVDDIGSFKDLLYIFQYSALGICLAKAYRDSNNIFVSISIHFIQNFLAAILVILLY